MQDFLSGTSIRLILTLASLAGLASVGQTILILLGGFDMSVAGFIVAGGLMVTQVASLFHWPFALALLIGLAGRPSSAASPATSATASRSTRSSSPSRWAPSRSDSPRR